MPGAEEYERHQFLPWVALAVIYPLPSWYRCRESMPVQKSLGSFSLHRFLSEVGLNSCIDSLCFKLFHAGRNFHLLHGVLPSPRRRTNTWRRIEFRRLARRLRLGVCRLNHLAGAGNDAGVASIEGNRRSIDLTLRLILAHPCVAWWNSGRGGLRRMIEWTRDGVHLAGIPGWRIQPTAVDHLLQRRVLSHLLRQGWRCHFQERPDFRHRRPTELHNLPFLGERPGDEYAECKTRQPQAKPSDFRRCLHDYTGMGGDWKTVCVETPMRSIAADVSVAVTLAAMARPWESVSAEVR